MNKRNLTIDFLRIVTAFMVVWLHTAHGYVIRNTDLLPASWWIADIADSFSRWSVGVFIMISGSFILEKATKEPLSLFYRRRLGRLVLLTIVWSLFFIVWKYLRSGNIDLHKTFKLVLEGQPYYHLWYLYMLTCLYALAPMTGHFATSCSRTTLFATICILFGMSSVNSITAIIEHSWNPTFFASWPPFIAFFMAGYYIRQYAPIIFTKKHTWFFIAACGTVIAAAAGLMQPVWGETAWSVMYTNQNPFVIIMSVGIFGCCTLSKPTTISPDSLFSKTIMLFSPLTLGIYCIHPAWLEICNAIGFRSLTSSVTLSIPLISISVFVLSALTAYMLGLVPGVRMMVR